MKAMILAAGFGKRLHPFTEKTPKPLFPVAGRPVLDIIIRALQCAGCEAIIINSHHLYQQIDTFIAEQHYPIPVFTKLEPVILGTGGAIKNVATFWNDKPFIVINSDIFTDIDLRKVYDFHINHSHPVTLTLYNDSEFNNVEINKNGFVTGFHDPETKENPGNPKMLTFTGIQVLDPVILDFIPANTFSSSIDVYKKMISEGRKLQAYISNQSYWKDIGTPERYKEAVYKNMTTEAFNKAFSGHPEDIIIRTQLKGDGSDRNWYRLIEKNRSLIMADHGIRKHRAISEVDSFVAIGRHLNDLGISVPEIYLYDTFSGLVFMQDLGDLNLQNVVRNAKNMAEITSCYKSVISLLVKLSIFGAKGFDLSWAYQTPYYDKELIIEKECRYFVDAFLRKYLGLDLYFEDFTDEFISLADKTLESSMNGFIHRDMQSRNIMVNDNDFYFIDFQGGRIGPIQYDLASLLVDPYVELPYFVQSDLLDYYIEMLSQLVKVDPDKFRAGYKYCTIARNLQILGAFGYLSHTKEKTYFEKYIPPAVMSLKNNLSALKNKEFPHLRTVVNKL